MRTTNYLEAPEYVELPGLKNPSVFLAGGITGCPDWQALAADLLDPEFFVINPRRREWPGETDYEAKRIQVEWEFKYLNESDFTLFYFPPSVSTQPITLYELGRHAERRGNLFIAVHPHYRRHFDVITQLRLVRPNQYVHDSLESLCAEMNEIL